MRLGVLTLGQDDRTGYLLDAVRAADIDVVTADAPITDAASTLREGGRIARADADVVLLLASAADAAPFAGEAALSLGCPILLAGEFAPALLDAAGALAEVGVSFDRLTLTGVATDGDRLLAYVRANEKRRRQKGIEAAHKLYGQRLALPSGGATHPFDRAQWLRQFGIVAVVADADAEADFRADDGDAYGALTVHLLRLLSETDPVTVPVGGPLNPTFVYARLSRRAGRFLCHAAPGDAPSDRLAEHLLSGRLHGLPAEHLPALRAACETLDVLCVMV
jgi:hypothetical protein